MNYTQWSNMINPRNVRWIKNSIYKFNSIKKKIQNGYLTSDPNKTTNKETEIWQTASKLIKNENPSNQRSSIKENP